MLFCQIQGQMSNEVQFLDPSPAVYQLPLHCASSQKIFRFWAVIIIFHVLQIKPVDFKSSIEKNKNDYRAAPSTNKSVPESKIKMGMARPQVASTSTTGNRRSLKGEGNMSTPAFAPKTHLAFAVQKYRR